MVIKTELSSLLEQSAALHRHLCPRQVLGVRMGQLAAELLMLSLPQSDKRLFVFVETDGCFADGVSVATGCWLGRRTMRLIDYGKVAATFVDTKMNSAFRIWPNPDARYIAEQYVPNEKSRWHKMLVAYQIIPTELLLCWKPVTLNLSMKQLIGNAGKRVNCSLCGEEIINQREVLRDGMYLCASCADGGYYSWTE
ncbi:MAG: formylmethanofuran dehydrogenase [Phototrophicales bacterium]|nr:MAG: formylmethanofuran dehydrogenase [Phototrophicales bacterium]